MFRCDPMGRAPIVKTSLRVRNVETFRCDPIGRRALGRSRPDLEFLGRDGEKLRLRDVPCGTVLEMLQCLDVTL
jgi:hypothetical protein